MTFGGRVLVDGTAWSNPRGEGRYLRGLLPALVEAAPDLDFVVLVEGPEGDSVAAALEGRVELAPLDGRSRPGARLAAGERRSVADLATLATVTRRLSPRAVLQPSLVGWFPTPGVPQLVGVHDLKPRGGIGREIVPGRLDNLLSAAKQRAGLRSARALYTPSVTTLEALRGRCGAQPLPSLAPPAIGSEFHPRSDAEIAAARRAVGLAASEPYVVCASGLNRHKEPGLIVDALALAAERGDRSRRLVLAGPPAGAYGSIGAELRRRSERVAPGLVLMPGYVPDPVLAALYCGAEAAVSASRFEGYGLTAVEAAACGARTVLSRIPAHLETSDGRADFFEPGDAAGLLDALARSAASPPPPPPVAAAYSWEPAAAAVSACLESVLSAASSSGRSRSRT